MVERTIAAKLDRSGHLREDRLARPLDPTRSADVITQCHLRAAALTALERRA